MATNQNRKMIAIMDIMSPNGVCVEVGCRHAKLWEEASENPCQKCIKAVASGEELRAQMFDETGEIWVILK